MRHTWDEGKVLDWKSSFCHYIESRLTNVESNKKLYSCISVWQVFWGGKMSTSPLQTGKSYLINAKIKSNLHNGKNKSHIQ